MKAIATALMLMLVCIVPCAADEKPQPQQQDKVWQEAELYWNPLPPNVILADVPSDESTNNACPGQGINCGDVLRPADITAGDNDYFFFTANAGDIITFGTDADGTPTVDTFIHLYNGDCTTELATSDDEGPGLYSLITFCATYTGTYVGRVRGFGATSAGIYKAFVTCSPSGGFGDNCPTATVLPCGDGSINLAGNTGCSVNDYTLPAANPCTGFTAAGRDQVLLLMVGGGSSINVTYTSTADGSIYIVDACAPVNCLAGADATLVGQPETLVYNFPAAGAYYLILDSFGTNSSGSWTLSGSWVCGLVPTRTATWGTIKTIYR